MKILFRVKSNKIGVYVERKIEINRGQNKNGFLKYFFIIFLRIQNLFFYKIMGDPSPPPRMKYKFFKKVLVLVDEYNFSKKKIMFVKYVFFGFII